MWDCAQCAEHIEDKFHFCWNCGTQRKIPWTLFNLASGSVPSERNQLKRDFDPETGITTITFRTLVSVPDDPQFSELGPVLALGLSFQCQKESAETVSSRCVLFFEYSVFEGSRPKPDAFAHQLHLLIETEQARFTGTLQRTIKQDPMMFKHEVAYTGLAQPSLLKIINSRTLRFATGAIAFELAEDQLHGLRGFGQACKSALALLTFKSQPRYTFRPRLVATPAAAATATAAAPRLRARAASQAS